jgi:hypothetical protein
LSEGGSEVFGQVALLHREQVAVVSYRQAVEVDKEQETVEVKLRKYEEKAEISAKRSTGKSERSE